MTVRHIIVHHSAGSQSATVQSVRIYHIEQRGWDDIGYHYVVRMDSTHGGWTVEPGRPLWRHGAHDVGQNADSIGVCIFGDYSGGQRPPAFGWLLLVSTVAGLCRQYGLTAADVEGHGENEPASTPTVCPGFSPVALRAAVQRALEGL